MSVLVFNVVLGIIVSYYEVGQPVSEVTPWSEWTPCSDTCGQGLKSRSRTCDIPPNAENVGECAAADLLQVEECNLGGCPGWLVCVCLFVLYYTGVISKGIRAIDLAPR